ncbi:MAG: dihydrofolate reductase family protein, partial [Saprospiraceae bacterium]
FIAKNDGDVSWMNTKGNYPSGVDLTEEDIQAFLERVDCYVMGSKTYESALNLGWPYGDKPVKVLTSRDLDTEKESVEFLNGDLAQVVKRLKTTFKNIWMVGGSGTTKSFLREGLVDEIVISILPIILGDGLLFFDTIKKEIPLELREVKAYKDGMVEMRYVVKK